MSKHHNQRVKSKHGHNVHASQHTDLPKMKHEIVMIPSSSPITTFNSYGLLDFKEKNCILHDIALMYDVQLPSSITAGSGLVVNTPDFNPALFWTTRIEIVFQNNVIDTIYPLAQFITEQLFQRDDERKIKNVAMGDYSNIVQRANLFSTGGKFIVPLWTFFKQGHIPMVIHNQDLQLRLYLDSLQNVFSYNGATIVPSAPVLNSCQLLAKISRLSNGHVDQIQRSLRSAPHHYKFLETRIQQYSVNASVSPYQVNIPMTAIVGKVSYLFFVVRPVSVLTGSPDAIWTFTPIQNFSILDSTGTNITGGQPVPHALALTLSQEDHVLSTYLTENLEGKGVTSNSANVYMYSFSASAHSSAREGLSLNTHRFKGNETLQILFNANLANSQVDIYAFTEAVLEIGTTGVKKVTL